ncbi:MAG TPA: hypothetical protein VJB10_03090 [Candidatus Peribacteraceae bacterium]|nr:hypothetical protein [Candidatus Peribacteraceae bacterium]
MDGDPEHQHGQEAERPPSHPDNHSRRALLEDSAASIAHLESSIMERFHLALSDADSGKDQLREALLFHGILQDTVYLERSRRDPALFQVCAGAHVFSEGNPTTMQRYVRVLEQPVSTGSSVRGITDAVEDNLSVYPRDAIAFLQHIHPDLPDKVSVLPSTQGSIRPLKFVPDTRFGYDATTRQLHDYRQTHMVTCLTRAEEVWDQLAEMATQKEIIRVCLQNNRSDPWKIHVFQIKPNPLRRFRSLLFPNGRRPLHNLTAGNLDDTTGWEEKFDEIYPYDRSRFDFAAEAIENVLYWVRELLASHDRVHLKLRLEGSSKADVIVTFYVQDNGQER